MRFKSESLAKRMLAGAAGGLLASYVMNQFQALWTAVESRVSEPEQPSAAGEDATVKTAEAISCGGFDRELTPEEKKWAGPVVHYAFGTLMGALYGAASGSVPGASKGYGAVYGCAVWVGADEIGVPALRLAQSPGNVPLGAHIREFAAHLVYGVTTGLATRVILRTAPRL